MDSLSPDTKELLADVLLYLHFAFVAFVVVGLIATYVGGFLKRPFATNRKFRLAHIGAIGFVVFETLIGMVCPLTRWEAELRGGWRAEDRPFIERWIDELLYVENPHPLLLPSIYVGVFLLTAAAWFRFPPKKP